MTTSKLIFNLLIVLIVGVLLYYGYQMLFNKGSPGASAEPGLSAAGFATGEATSTPADEFLITLNGLQGLNLNGDVFTNPVFKDLKDSNIVLPEETPGRPNPFAPVDFNALPRPHLPAAGVPSATASTSALLNSLRAR